MSIKIGDTRIFRNKSAYPSLDCKKCTVTGLPDSEYEFYGVIFENGLKMAVTESEILIPYNHRKLTRPG
jgi:hypothetical protein